MAIRYYKGFSHLRKRVYSSIIKPETLNLKGAWILPRRKFKGDRPRSNFLGALLG